MTLNISWDERDHTCLGNGCSQERIVEYYLGILSSWTWGPITYDPIKEGVVRIVVTSCE